LEGAIMNENEGACRSCCGWVPWAIGVIGSFLVVGGLAWLVVVYTRPAVLGQDRIALRLKNLREVRAAESESSAQYGWVDQAKGIVRLPIHRAVEIAGKEWTDPAAARADLIARVEKATAKAPEPKSAFE
jgi:hypothetical protein